MKFANVFHSAVFAAIGLINCAVGTGAHAQRYDDTARRIFYSRGEQQWLYAEQRSKTAPVTVFHGSSSTVFRGDFLPPWFALWNASKNSVRVAPLNEQQAQIRGAIVRVFDAYVRTLRDELGQSPIEPISLSRDTTLLSGGLTGRVTTLRGADTVVNGVTLRIMTDVAKVVLTDTVRWPNESLEHGRIDVQRLRGTVTSRRLYDIGRRVSIQSWDSVALEGRETRKFAGGHVISGAVRLQLVRHGEMVNLAELTQRSAQFSDSIGKAAASFSEAYLQLGDSTEREARARLLAPQDEAGALATLQLPQTLGYTKWHYELLRPALNDPQRAMSMGFDANIQLAILRGMAADILRTGPATPRPAFCSDDACQLIQQEWTHAKEPQLRNIGLMFRYLDAPACYVDALLEQSKAYPAQFPQMTRYVLGITQTNSNATPVLIPALRDNWRAWFDWLRGAPAQYFASVKPTPMITAADSAARAANPYGFGPSYNVAPALNHIAYRTGFAYRDTFNVRFDRETNDTARVVYSTLSKWMDPQEAYDTTSAQWRTNRACQKRK